MKYAVLKVDDLRLTNPTVQRFLDLFAWAAQENIPLSVGVIGNCLIGGRRADKLYLSSLIERGLLEVWNHTNSHVNLTKLNMAQVRPEIEAAQKAIEATLGCTPTLFGAPFNQTNGEVAAIVADLGFTLNYETGFDPHCRVTPENNVPLDGQPRASLFSDVLARRSTEPYLVVQVHPGRWSREGFAEFKECINLMRARGYHFVTAQSLVGVLSHATTDFPGFFAHITSEFEKNVEQKTSELSNYCTYFLNRFSANALPLAQLWQQWAFNTKAFSVVDVGSGLAQWSLPFLLFSPKNRVAAFDTNATICSAINAAKTNCKALKNLQVLCEDFTSSASIKPRSTNLVVCADALNYISVEKFIRKCSHICTDGAFVVLLMQTSAFNKAGVVQARKDKNKEALRERALSELQQQLLRVGHVHLRPERTTYTMAELAALFYAQKFKMYDTFVPAWEPRFEGEPQYQGIVFQLDQSLPSISELPANTRDSLLLQLEQSGHSPELELLSASKVPQTNMPEARFVEAFRESNFALAKTLFEQEVVHGRHELVSLCKILVEEAL